MIDLEYAFNNSFKNASVNESYDIEKNKVLKDIIEFKTKQLDEIFDNNDVNYFNSDVNTMGSKSTNPTLIDEKIYSDATRNIDNDSDYKENSYI